jgi:hypothetical protein
LIRETGWVYARATRTPRMIDELLAAFDHIRTRLRLAPGWTKLAKAGGPA